MSHEPVSLDLADLQACIAPCTREVSKTITSLTHRDLEAEQSWVTVQWMGRDGGGHLFDQAKQWSDAVASEKTKTFDYRPLKKIEIHIKWGPPDRGRNLIITGS